MFTLLHLQEGEEYVQDFKGEFKFCYPPSRAELAEPGTIRFCTHSLILEAENPSLPILKYMFKYMQTPPEQAERKGGEKFMRFDCARVIEIPASKTPQPQKRHDLPAKKDQQVEIKLHYSALEPFVKAVSYLYAETKKNLSDTEYQKILRTFMEDEERFGKVVFDKTRIKNISEKPLLSKELRVMQILPLVQIEGLVYLTDQRIYFQPLHSINTKPLMSTKICNIVGLFKRRYKLKQVPLVIFFEP
jgi:factor associated with neutral sphingomyelinase activation